MTDLLKKNTDELLKELTDKGCDIQEYIDSNPNSFIEINLNKFWHGLIEKSGMKNADIINKSDFSYVYFYDVASGKKIPSRDKILRLILAMHLTLDDCQTAMHYCGKAKLYPRIKRDSLLIYAIEQKLTVGLTQELLKEKGEERLK